MKGSTVQKLKKIPLNLLVTVAQPNGNSMTYLILTFSNDYTRQNLVVPFTVLYTGTVRVTISRLGNNLAPKDPITIGYHMALQP